MAEEVFGNQAQRALLTRGRALYALLRDDARFTYYGRGIGLLRPSERTVDDLRPLISLLGASNVACVPDRDADALREALGAAGFATGAYRRWEGGAEALNAAARILRDVSPPSDVAISRLDGSTPRATLDSLAETAIACEVLPLHGDALRGGARPGCVMIAQDGAGRVIGCAGSVAFAHESDSERGSEAWWGMLATHPERRGARLGLLLGAMALLEMRRRFGFGRFFTGVQTGNAPSETVCARTGFTAQASQIVSVSDPAAMPGGRITK